MGDTEDFFAKADKKNKKNAKLKQNNLTDVDAEALADLGLDPHAVLGDASLGKLIDSKEGGTGVRKDKNHSDFKWTGSTSTAPPPAEAPKPEAPKTGAYRAVGKGDSGSSMAKKEAEFSVTKEVWVPLGQDAPPPKPAATVVPVKTNHWVKGTTTAASPAPVEKTATSSASPTASPPPPTEPTAPAPVPAPAPASTGAWKPKTERTGISPPPQQSSPPPPARASPPPGGAPQTAAQPAAEGEKKVFKARTSGAGKVMQ